MISPSNQPASDEPFTFVSYDRSDASYAISLTEFLRGHRLATWIDLETEPGKFWDKRIFANLKSCSAAIVLMSPMAESSEWVQLEIENSRQLGKPILPLLLKGTVFPRLIRHQYEDVRSGAMPSSRFVTTLRGHLGQKVSAEAAGHDRLLHRTNSVRARALNLMSAGLFHDAERLLRDSITSGAYDDGSLAVYLAVASMAGRPVSYLDAGLVSQTEQLLVRAAKSEANFLDAIRLLLVLRHDAYLLNGRREPRPGSHRIAEQIASHPQRESIDEIFSYVLCSSKASNLAAINR